MIELSRDEARELAVAAQGLAWPDDGPATKDAMRATIQRLACIQIDTIHVVARSQYIVLWSRLGQYDQDVADELLHPDREVFEYWAHAASVIADDLRPYFRSRMEHYRAAYYAHPWTQENRHVVEQVLHAVREHGPLRSTHFKAPERDGPVPEWAWYGGKPTNRALDLLWSTGELAVHRRENFQRFYDLPERVYPDWHEMETPSPEEERRVLAERAVRAMGVCLPRWLNDYFRTKWGVRGHPGPPPAEILDELAEAGRLIPVQIEDLGAGFVAAEHAALLDDVRQGARATRTTLLSPFDNLIWDRQRLLELFDFEYRIEVYTPAAKRRYGYFNLPILHRGRLIGRLDPKADRRAGELIVKSLHLEPGVQVDPAMTEAVRDTLDRFARFNRCTTVRIESMAEALNGSLPPAWEVPA